jgi:hypothetical protein
MLPHAEAPVEASRVYCCGGERSIYCCFGVEESKKGGGDTAATVAYGAKGGDGEGGEDADAAAALAHAVAPVEAPSGDGDAAAAFAHGVAPIGAPSAAAAGLYGEWKSYSISCCCAEKRRFRKDQVTRRVSVARLATFGNWRLAAELGSEMASAVTTDVVS